MNSLVQKIFEFCDYKNIGNSDLQLFKSNTIDDFWLVYSGEPEFFDYETQAKLLSQCKELCQDKPLEKNLNLLCLWKVNEINKNVTARLHYLEEDLYFFKKHVLYFTTKEYTALSAQLDSLNLRQLITEQLVNPSTFACYKENKACTWEPLLYRIAIKLTFLPISLEAGGELTELYSSHNQRLSTKGGLALLDDIVQKMDEQVVFGEPENIINYINQSMVDML